MCFMALLSREQIYLHDVLMFFKFIIGLVDFMFGELLIIIVHSIIMASCILGECCQFLSCTFQFFWTLFVLLLRCWVLRHELSHSSAPPAPIPS